MPTLDVAINARKAKAGTAQFDSSVKKIKRGGKDIDRSVKSNTKSFSSFGGQIKNVATGLISLAVAYKGLRFAQSAVKEIVAFEMELANVSTMLDEQTMAYLPGYETELTKLAIKYGQSTATLSKGLYDILSASIKASDALDFLEVSARTAIGGFVSTAIAVDALTTIINAYGLNAADAARISDILSATVKRGKITFEELAGTIGHVVSIAAAAGLSFEQASAAIATMTRSGIDANMAMTALKGIITGFMKPTDEAAKLAKDKFGLALNTATLRTIELTGALELLKNATAEEIAIIFPNVRALLGVASARKSLTALINDYKGILETTGLSEINYQKAAATTAQQLRINAEIWKSIKRDLGKGLLPEVRRVLDDLAFLSIGWKEIWKDIYRSIDVAQYLIEHKMAPTAANREFVNLMLDTDEAVGKVNKTYKDIENTLDRLAKQYEEGFDVAPMPVVDLGVDGVGETEEAIKARQKEIEAIENTREKAEGLIREVQLEQELLFLTNEERERSIKLQELEAISKDLGAKASEDLRKRYMEELESLRDMQQIKELTDIVVGSLGELVEAPLEALLDGTKDLGDALEDQLENLGRDILRTLYKQMITQPIKQWATSFVTSLFMGEKGAVFNSGQVTAFGKGDVVYKPTIFPMANGMGIMAEKKPEAVMPLTRDKSGNLGVRAEGVGTSNIIKMYNILDESLFEDYLSGGNGERAVINIMRRNPEVFSEVSY